MIKEQLYYFVNKKATNKNETNRKVFETNLNETNRKIFETNLNETNRKIFETNRKIFGTKKVGQ